MIGKGGPPGVLPFQLGIELDLSAGDLQLSLPRLLAGFLDCHNMLADSHFNLGGLCCSRVAAVAAPFLFHSDPGLTTRANFIPPLRGYFRCEFSILPHHEICLPGTTKTPEGTRLSCSRSHR